MSNTEGEKPKRVEVWLTKVSDFRITCREVYEDESTSDWDVDAIKSVSMRGAQREVTGHFLDEGYEPVDRWVAEEIAKSGHLEGEVVESFRRFQLKARKVVIKGKAAKSQG